MTPSQCVGYMLTQTSAVSSLVSSRIYCGTRPMNTGVPCINYFEQAGGTRQFGMETRTFSINCRATTAETAMQIARAVADLFHGTSGTGTYGTQSGFSIVRACLRSFQGLIPETGDNLYNAPVDVQVVYPYSTVS